MIYQKDWLMRQIEQMVAAILHVLDNLQPSLSQSLNEEQILRDRISTAISLGQFCETENWLYQEADTSDPMWLRLAVFFYSEANKLGDDYLEVNHFSREEVASGLMDFCKNCGYDLD